MAYPVPGKRYRSKEWGENGRHVTIQVTRVTQEKIPAFGGPVDVEAIVVEDREYPYMAPSKPGPFGSIERFDATHDEVG